VAKESKIMAEIHKIREEFYRKTKGKNRVDILKMIKEGGNEVIKELSAVELDSKLIQKEKYSIPRLDSMEGIHQIKEQKGKYGKKCAKKAYYTQRLK